MVGPALMPIFTPMALPEASFLESIAETGGGLTHSYGGISFGDPHPSRVIVCGISVENDRTAVSATIGGIAADIYANAARENTGVTLIGARVPTGPTGTVTVTWNSNPLEGSRCATFRCLHLREVNQVDAENKTSGGGANLNVDTENNGIVIVAASMGILSGPSVTGVTESDSDDLYWFGFASNVAAASPRSVDFSDSGNYSAVSVSLR